MAKKLSFVIFVLAYGVYFMFIKSNFNAGEAIAGKNVVVTGASSGIGEQLAYQYAKLKANLVITARREKQLQDVANRCKQLGSPKVEIVIADLSKADDRARLVRETEKHFGKKVDYLILNHAIFSINMWSGSTEDMAYLQNTLDINFLSYVDLSSKFLNLLTANEGHIGVVSAVCGIYSCPSLAPHSASKAALHGFFAAWRQELRYRNIPVSVTLCILGLVDTEAAMSQAVGMNPPISPQTLAVSALDSADAIIESVALRQYELLYPTYVSLSVKLHAFFSTLVEDVLGISFLTGMKK